jgi:hypothetical protein
MGKLIVYHAACRMTFEANDASLSGLLPRESFSNNLFQHVLGDVEGPKVPLANFLVA